jgi:urease accessory protein
MNKALLTITTWLTATPVLAHHPLEGNPVETFAQGLLSGIGHPLLGYDHLFFIALVGIAAVFTAHRFLSPLAYISAMLGGCLLAAFGNVLPAGELMVAVSLLVLGGIMLTGYRLQSGATIAIFILFGLFHGSTFGSFLAAQESAAGFPVLIGYLLGLGITQYGLALAAGWICREGWNATEPGAIQPRLAAALVAGVGLLLTLESIGAR